jgi:hypothetical protein
MRIYVAVAIALLLVLVVSFITLDKLDSTADEMVAGFGGLEKAIAEGSWADADRGVEQVGEKWNRHKGWWPMVIDHQEIDNIDMALARIRQYIGMQDGVMAAGELAVLKQMLEHIPEKERVNLKNIF